MSDADDPVPDATVPPTPVPDEPQPDAPAVPITDGLDASEPAPPPEAAALPPDTSTPSWPPVTPPAEPAPAWMPTAPTPPSGPPPLPPAPPQYPGSDPIPSPPGRPGSSRRIGLAVVSVVVALIIGFAVTTIVLNANDSPGHVATSTPTTVAPATTVPDPHADALAGLIVRQGDVPSGYTVELQPQGTDAVHGTTLDLCNGTYASESSRTARRQVDVVDAQGSSSFSTEAVLYRTPAAAQQALTELRKVIAQCPNTPVVSPVGEPTVTTKFLAAPDTTWPNTPGVERAAYDFQISASDGTTVRSTAVYLWRGRALLAVYFSSTKGPQVAVGGKTTTKDIVAEFASRLAALPASVVNAP